MHYGLDLAELVTPGTRLTLRRMLVLLKNRPFPSLRAAMKAEQDQADHEAWMRKHDAAARRYASQTT